MIWLFASIFLWNSMKMNRKKYFPWNSNPLGSNNHVASILLSVCVWNKFCLLFTVSPHYIHVKRIAFSNFHIFQHFTFENLLNHAIKPSEPSRTFLKFAASTLLNGVLAFDWIRSVKLRDQFKFEITWIGSSDLN